MLLVSFLLFHLMKPLGRFLVDTEFFSLDGWIFVSAENPT